MFGDRAVRPSTTPISSAMPARRWLAISRSTGFMSGRLEEQASQSIDGEPPPRWQERGRAVLADDRRTPQPRPHGKRVPPDDRARLAPPVEDDVATSDGRRSPVTRRRIGGEYGAAAA